jgi:MFS family permease
MLKIVKKTFAPLLSLFIFTLGSGLFTTLLAVRLHLAGSSDLVIGSMTAAFYAGLVCGSFRIERFIVRVGHIRAFAAFASTLAVVTILQGMIIHIWVWLLLRLVGGFVTAGLYVVIESWLLVQSDTKTRGQILAIYMVGFYAAQALGQFLINTANPETLILFALSAMLCSLSVIPLAMSYVSSPEFGEPSTLSFRKLYQISASGVIGCFAAGLVLGAIYGLLPLYVSQQFQKNSLVAVFMASTIFGGMALQYPVGRLSDFLERRLLLVIVSVLAGGVSILIMLFTHNVWLLVTLCFFLGGLTFTLYPLCISHACDYLDANDFVAGTQGLLLAYSVGSTIGPLLAPVFMHFFGSNGLFVFFLVVTVLLALFFVWRKTQRASVPSEEQFISVPQNTPIMAELDPRIDDNDEPISEH